MNKITYWFNYFFIFTLISTTMLEAKEKPSTSRCTLSQDENMIKICQELADKGDAKAQNTLGLIYLEANPMINGNHTKARLLFKKAAEQGLADAQYNLGAMYRDELNNFPIALQWFEKAAAQNHAEAQNSIGYIYENGYKKECQPRDYNFDEYGNSQDAQQAYYAKFKNVVMTYSHETYLGVIPYSEFGCGVDQNYIEAAKWYQKAADQGLALAQTNLGYLYLQGLGVPKDESKGFQLVSKAADQNFAPALNMLSFLYFQGIGTKKDPIKGIETVIRSNNAYPVNFGSIESFSRILYKYIGNRFDKKVEWKFYTDQLKKEERTYLGITSYINEESSDEDKLFYLFNDFKYFYQLNYFKASAIFRVNVFDSFRLSISNITNEAGGDMFVRELNLYTIKKAYQGQLSAIQQLFTDYDVLFYVYQLLPEDQSLFYLWFEREENMGGTGDIERIQRRIDSRKKGE